MKPHKNNHTDIAFIFGNGKSRLNVNLESFLELGTVYGCNAQYREFEPHYLIAVDVKMVNEIIASGYDKNHQVWTNPNKGITPKNNVNLFSPHKGWSSGPTALHFAAKNGHKEIYFFGFDYKGNEGKFNNVYADTYNYKKSTDAATYHGNWLNQTERTVKEFKNVNFYRVIESNAFIPDKLGPQHQNLKHITYKDLGNLFGSAIYTDQMNQKTTI